MRRAIYIANFVLVIATLIGWIFVIWGAVLEFFLGVLQLICVVIYLTKWRTFSSLTKKHFKNYLASLLTYVIIVVAGFLFMGPAFNNGLEMLSAWFVMGAAMLLAGYFTYLCLLVHRDKKEVFMEVDDNVLDSGFIDGSAL